MNPFTTISHTPTGNVQNDRLPEWVHANAAQETA